MGQKVNPHGFRVGVIKDWNSRWFTKDESFGDTLVSDYNVRKFLKEKYKESGVPKIEIERDNKRVRVFLHCAKPGLVIGRGGAEIDKLKLGSGKLRFDVIYLSHHSDIYIGIRARQHKQLLAKEQICNSRTALGSGEPHIKDRGSLLVPCADDQRTSVEHNDCRIGISRKHLMYKPILHKTNEGDRYVSKIFQ